MQSGAGAPGPPDGAGGLIVMVRTDPARAAHAIAAELGADLAVGGPDAERALAGLDTRRRQHQDLNELRHAMRRADAVRDRTRAEIAARVSSALNSHVAIHPNTLRRAATEYEASQLALHQALARDVRRRRLANVGRGAAAAATVLLSAALVLAGAIPAGAVAAAAGVILVAWWAARASHDAAIDHPGLARHVEVARSRWEQVAGPGADPSELESVVRRYDPQDSLVGDLVGQNPAVRAVDRVALERRMAWVSAWRIEVGDHTPITDPDAAELLQHAQAQLWLTGSGGLAGSHPETLVVASPYEGLPTERARDLHRQLLGVPRAFRVIVVLAPDAAEVTDVRDQAVSTAGWVPGDTEASPIS